ncbi:MAG: lysophospholipid acyltransferase family protein [Rhodospirillales bacterium]|jgi:1-acyl-sn-glycerol-3-phosphate acyltransferase|nr:lysophospholipid acyltransferase family protein [Rhodospirillales bacterium]HJO97840.1 lysophospholipid acyltransferase family protein [Rhodospirillales bacterium]
MTVLRSLVFNVFFFAWLAFVLVVMLLFLPLPRRVMQNAVRVWTHVMGLGLKVIVGLDYEVRGRQHIPWGGVIFACKHQSAWETMAFHILFSDTSYVIKKELFAVPLFGWYARKCQSIPVDRAGGGAALRRLIRDARIQIAAGRPLVIFPEGTRMAPGTRGAYHPGVFALYKQARAPVVPVALNSGLYWGRRQFVKRPGVMVIEFLEAMPEGLDRHQFMAELERRVEAASGRLVDEAQPHHPPVSG